MQVIVKFPSVSDLESSAAQTLAPRLSSLSSSSLVSLLEKVFGVDNSIIDILPTKDEIASVEQGKSPLLPPLINRTRNRVSRACKSQTAIS